MLRLQRAGVAHALALLLDLAAVAWAQPGSIPGVDPPSIVFLLAVRVHAVPPIFLLTPLPLSR